MDKKNTVIGIALLMAAFTLMVFQQKDQPAPAPSETQVEEVGEKATVGDRESAPPSETTKSIAPALPFTPGEVSAEDVEEELVQLENEYIAVVFTNLGGAIREVALKLHAAAKGSDDPYLLNHVDPIPALALLELPGAGPTAGYRVIKKSESEITYGISLGDVEILRHYTLEQGEKDKSDPGAYLITHRTEFRNTSGQPLLLGELGVHLGTAEPIGRQSVGMDHLNFSYFDGESFERIATSKFKGGGIRSWVGLASGVPKEVIAEKRSFEWATVKNQFFTSILTPEQPPSGFVARPVEMALEPGDKSPAIGITAAVLFDLKGIPAEETETLSGTFYTGPKEYRRLESLGMQQDRVMQFGWPFFAFISKMLLSMMIAIHSVVPNYGLSIILVTVLIKTVLWPLTATAARSSKRMAKIQAPMKEMREKYKGDPRRVQAETMKLFKEAKVNPLGGCLPMLVQIPIFFGLFRMIGSAAELRFEEFLWIGDLSAPDTIAMVMGFPLNILPILMGVTMFYQMRMMPMAMDNAQQKIFRLMPLVMFAFCYTFSSGLVLYWTVQNLLTILQQFLTNRKKDDAPVGPTGPGGEAVQVSPYSKKGKGSRKKQEKK